MKKTRETKVLNHFLRRNKFKLNGVLKKLTNLTNNTKVRLMRHRETKITLLN